MNGARITALALLIAVAATAVAQSAPPSKPSAPKVEVFWPPLLPPHPDMVQTVRMVELPRLLRAVPIFPANVLPPLEIEMIVLSTPTYPPLARQANITGDETVLVKVKPDGTVESAVVESGHPMLVLRQAATDSALKSRFECRNCAEKMPYRVVYIFKIVQGKDCCTALSSAAKVEQHADSSAQSRVTVEAEQVCICEPLSVAAKRVRSPKCLYLWKCSVR